VGTQGNRQGQFDTGDGIRDRELDQRQFDGRRLDDRRLDSSQRDSVFGSRRERGEDQLEDGRLGDEGTDRLRGSRSENAFGTTGRQQRVQWIAGRWWFQRGSGEWLTWDPQAADWQRFNPRILDRSGGLR
jgi:hypothetical protein